ncbi:MAG: hypothetical protein A2231_03580 [Candidatus Firestonebacteria bacterium RIFOXYA2_FULL_40_8]|nr:MAG: hypothetical protein A2231_03580 [Candidatus Firestonebacteria bacterium RIFOXYA2_FULL_40_8]
MTEADDINKPYRCDNLSEVLPKEVQVRTIKPSQFVRTIPGSPEPVPGAVVPVWVTVNVPKDAKADEYEGELKITLENGGPFNVPVKLKVYDYALPNPNDFVTWAELIQSPETLALVYKVPLWSEKHWKLIEKSLAYIGAFGTKTCYIPLICKTNMGNAESMVRWTKEKDKYKYDFSIMDKYLDLVEKYQGKPSVVCLYVWDIFLNEGEWTYEKVLSKEINEERAAAVGKGPEVTILKNGKSEVLELPKYTGTEANALWKPLVTELKARLQKRKLDKAMMIGIETDTRPDAAIVKFWKEILPEAPWVKQAHNLGKNQPGYTASVWSRHTILDSIVEKSDVISGKGWKSKYLDTFFPRGLRNNDVITTFRMLGEITAFGKQRGFARLGADFWDMESGKGISNFIQHGASGGIASDGRFLKSSWRALNIRTSLLASGPDGAITTTRYEMMREGLQECEARIMLEKALDEQKLRIDQAKKVEKLLKERNLAIYNGFYDNRADFTDKKGKGFSTYHWSGSQIQRYCYLYYLNSGWQKRSSDLYEAASQATGKR